jgi:hypothetical protein
MMPSRRTGTLIQRATRRVPVLRNLPVVRLLAIAEVALIAHDHITKLAPDERRRLIDLLRIGHLRPRNLSAAEQDELRELVAKAEPRLFVGEVADKLSPVKLPERVVRGRPKDQAH